MRKPFTFLVSVIAVCGVVAILAEGFMVGSLNWDIDHAQGVLAKTFVILSIPALLLVYFLLSLAAPDEARTGRVWKAMSIPLLVFLIGIAYLRMPELNIWITMALTGVLVWFTLRAFRAGHSAVPYHSSTRGFWSLFLPFLALDLITYEVPTYGMDQPWQTLVELVLFGVACAVSFRLVGYMHDHHHSHGIPLTVCTRPDADVIQVDIKS